MKRPKSLMSRWPPWPLPTPPNPTLNPTWVSKTSTTFKSHFPTPLEIKLEKKIAANSWLGSGRKNEKRTSHVTCRKPHSHPQLACHAWLLKTPFPHLPPPPRDHLPNLWHSTKMAKVFAQILKKKSGEFGPTPHRMAAGGRQALRTLLIHNAQCIRKKGVHLWEPQKSARLVFYFSIYQPNLLQTALVSLGGR